MVLLDFSMTPLGKGESVSAYVARCLEVVAASGLDYRLHAMGTTLEGELDQVLDVVRRCFAALEADCDRVSCCVKLPGSLSPIRKYIAAKTRRITTPVTPRSVSRSSFHRGDDAWPTANAPAKAAACVTASAKSVWPTTR